MARGLKFEVGDGDHWATDSLEDWEYVYESPSQETIDLLKFASKLESKKDYRILDHAPMGDAPMLNPILGRVLTREIIERYFRRFKPEYGNPLHIELVSSMEYLNAYHS
ncbi:MAG: hypothetical protein WCI72_05765 [archaeon]